MFCSVRNKKPKGIYSNGVLVGGYPTSPKMKLKFEEKAYKRASPSFGDEQTSGYAISFSVNSSVSFPIYSIDNPRVPLTEIPEHSFVFYNGVSEEINTLTLIYDGEGLFHIEGEIQQVGYDPAKELVVTNVSQPVGVFMIDKNGNFFLTDNAFTPINSTKASSTTTITFLEPILTYETEIVRVGQKIIDVTLPCPTYPNFTTELNIDTTKTLYAVGSSGRISTAYTYFSYIL